MIFTTGRDMLIEAAQRHRNYAGKLQEIQNPDAKTRHEISAHLRCANRITTLYVSKYINSPKGKL